MSPTSTEGIPSVLYICSRSMMTFAASERAMSASGMCVTIMKNCLP